MNHLNNPLKQYFRRPSVYVKLPSGGMYYDQNTVKIPENGEIPVYPMTAIDDITAKTPDALFNGQAMIDIIKSCVPDIKDPWQLNSMDIDAILIAIKSASSDQGMAIGSQCPSCSEETNYNLDLSRLLADIQPADYTQPLQIGDLKVTFRPLTYKEMNEINLVNFQMQKRFGNLEAMENNEQKMAATREALTLITTTTMNTIANSIKSISLPNGTLVEEKEYISDYLKNCEKTSYDLIKNHNLKLKESGEVKPVKFTCPNCNHKYNQRLSLNVSDFFV